jgi:hypothetical protein
VWVVRLLRFFAWLTVVLISLLFGALAGATLGAWWLLYHPEGRGFVQFLHDLAR